MIASAEQAFTRDYWNDCCYQSCERLVRLVLQSFGKKKLFEMENVEKNEILYSLERTGFFSCRFFTHKKTKTFESNKKVL